MRILRNIFRFITMVFGLVSIFAPSVFATKPSVGFFLASGKCQSDLFVFTNVSTTGGSIEYLWKFGDGTTSIAANPNHSFPKTGNSTLYKVWLIVTDYSTLEVDSLSKDIEVKETTKPVASANSPVCENEELPLYVDPIFQASWQWQGPNSFTSTDQLPIISSVSLSGHGNYIVWATIDGCLSEPDTVVIQVLPLPVFNIGKDTTLCSTQTLTLSVPLGFDRYLWNDMLLSQTYTPTESGTYWVEIMSKGCRKWDTIRVTINKTPQIILNSKIDTVCEGGILFLSTYLELGATFTWSGPNAYSAIGYAVEIPNVSPAMSGKYALNAVNMGCFAEPDTVYVVVNPLPVFSLGNDTTVCSDKMITLKAPLNFKTYKWNNGSTKSTLIPYGSGDYWLEVTEKTCVKKETIHITVNPKPLVDLGVDKIFCQGKKITLENYNQLDTYLWPDGSTQSTFIADTTGVFWLRGSTKNCFATDTIKLFMQPTPTVNLGKDTSLCYGQTVIWNLFGDYDFIQWEDGSNYRSHEANVTSWYTVEVGKNKCFATDSIKVSIYPIPSVYLGKDIAICSGSSAVLDPTNTYQIYKWQDGSSQKTFVAHNAGTYWLEVNQNGCIAADTIKVSLNPLPVINLGNDTVLCVNQNLTLKPIGSYDTFLWQNGSRYNFLIAEKPGLYWAEVMKDGCIKRDTIVIGFYQAERIYVGKDTAFCQGGAVTLDAGAGYKTYHWSNGAVGQATRVDITGKYIATVEKSNGCQLVDTAIVTVWPLPVITKIDTSHLRQLSVVAGNGTAPYKFSLDGSDFQSSRDFYNLATGYYNLLIVDANGCISETNKIHITAKTLQIPNFFTPNGDGFNDEWVIGGLTDYPDAIVKIFDRNGKLLVVLKNGIDSWDGNFNGSALPSDTYWYMIYMKPEYKPQTGHVTIKR